MKPKEFVVSSRTKKYFSVFAALYPILCLYKAFFRFTIGDVILMLFLLKSFAYPLERDRRFPIVAVFSVYALFMLCLNLFLPQTMGETQELSALLFRIIKFIFYMWCVFACGKRFFNFKTFQKTIFIASIAACFYLVYQYAMYYFAGKLVLGRVPGLALYLDEYSRLDYNRIFSYQFRPSSFFLEPALFCHYIVVALILALFTKEMPKGLKRVFLVLLFTAGMLMSTAGQGVAYLGIVYFIYACKEIKNKMTAVGFLVFAAIVALIAYSTIDVVRAAVDRLLFNEKAAEGRFGAFKYVFELKAFPLLFGHGYGATPVDEFMSGAAYIWYGCGIIGLLLVFGIFGTFYRQASSTIAKVTCLIYFVMFFGTGIFYNYMLFWYFMVILCTANLKGDIGHEHSLHPRSLRTPAFGERNLFRPYH